MTQNQTELERLKIAEKRCARTIKGKALLVIDYLLCNIESKDPLLSKFYRIAHSAIGVCGNHHEDWVEETHRTYQELIK